MQITVLCHSHFSTVSYFISIVACGCCYCLHTDKPANIFIIWNSFLHTSYVHFPVSSFLHVSGAGSPAADATSDSGPDHLPPAPTQNAQCSAVRGGPAGRRSHPGRRQIEIDFHSKNTLYCNNIYLIYGGYFHSKFTLCLCRVVCQMFILLICFGSLLAIFVILCYGELP